MHCGGADLQGDRIVMRKAQKKQAEDFMGRLAYAYESIENAIRDGNKFMAAQWLEQCREDALRLGKLAEKSEGESCGLIPLVEEYCRLADRIQEQTGRGEGKSTHRLRKRLRRKLKRFSAGRIHREGGRICR